MKKALKRMMGINEDGWLRPMYLHLRSSYGATSLEKLAAIHGSDKKFGHNYIPLYERFFGPIRTKVRSLLEIGIGGYENPKHGGESLRIWSYYFPKAEIFGLDIYEKKLP